MKLAANAEINKLAVRFVGHGYAARTGKQHLLLLGPDGDRVTLHLGSKCPGFEYVKKLKSHLRRLDDAKQQTQGMHR